MFDKIRKSLGYFFLRKMVKKNNPVAFKGFYSEASKIMLAVPENPESANAVRKVISELIADGKKVEIFINTFLIERFVSKYNIAILSYSEIELTKLKLPNKALESRISASKCDLFIDLDFTESLLNYTAASLLNAKIKVGFSKEKSDRFYNFQVPATERNYEISFGNLLNSLRMF